MTSKFVHGGVDCVPRAESSGAQQKHLLVQSNQQNVEATTGLTCHNLIEFSFSIFIGSTWKSRGKRTSWKTST